MCWNRILNGCVNAFKNRLLANVQPVCIYVFTYSEGIKFHFTQRAK
jgi:hypothetical protein